MSRAVYWFSGTGNSLWAARRLAVRLDCPPPIPLTSGPSCSGSVSSLELAILVCPLYFWGLPDLVVDWLRGLDPSRVTGLALVLTRGGSPGGAVSQFERILARIGIAPLGAWKVTMPGNYVPLFPLPSPSRRARLLDRAEEKLDAIAAAIRAGRWGREGDNFLWARVSRQVNRRWKKRLPDAFVRFRASELCSSCGTCRRVCPVGNIELPSGRPVWGAGCQGCLACLHFCPEQAIDFGPRTARRGRYHCPGITADDIAAQGEARRDRLSRPTPG